MERLQTMKIRETKTHRMQQLDARVYKAAMHEIFKELFETLEIDVYEIENGLMLEIPHDDYGAIPIEAKFVIKPLNTDVEAYHAQHLEKEADRQAKAEAKAKEREK